MMTVQGLMAREWEVGEIVVTQRELRATGTSDLIPEGTRGVVTRVRTDYEEGPFVDVVWHGRRKACTYSGAGLTLIFGRCGNFTPSEGAAWPWCDTCGTRADLHRGNDERTAGYRKAVHRIVHR